MEGMDELPQTPRKPKPANANAGPSFSARKRKPDFGASMESRFVGYMVLGFGVLAVVSVLLIAANRFGGKSETQTVQSATPQPVAEDAEKKILPPAAVYQQNPALQNRVADDLLGSLPKPFSAEGKQYKKPPKSELYFDRQPNLKSESIEGAWQATISNNTAVLQISKGTYQIVMADPQQYSNRLYSSGVYKMVEDMIVLTPRMDWPAPNPPKNTDVKYSNITTAEFPVMAAVKGGNMLWQNPPSTETRLYVPRALALLPDVNQGYIVWKPIKR
jgi:Na+-transporting methylmalonyl-CoA/oxaloacetate decarboxylase gamma subunit